MAGAIGPPRAEPDRAPTIPQLAGSRLGDKIQWTSPNLLEPAGTACARNKLSFYGAVLKVRIHLPPAVSPRLARFCPPTARSRLFARVCGPSRCSAVSRDGHDAAIWRQRVIISLSGPIPVPQRQ